jgi:TPR repeat protein
MSSPVQDDADKQLIRALPWVNDPRRQDESRRLQEEVIEAAQRLERESSALLSQPRAQPPQQRTDVGFRLAEARSIEEKCGLEEITERVWAPLTPELMPPPPKEMRLPGLGLVAGLIGAVGVAAAVALVVADVVRIPTINAADSSEDKAERSQSVSTAILGRLPQIEAAQANVQPAEAPPTGPVLAAAQTNDVTVAKPSAAEPPTSPKVGTARPDLNVGTAPPDTKTPPTAAVSEPRAAVSLSRDEIASLLKRGQDLIAAGDVASGRLMLTHLAEAGDAEASFILAGTYDAAVLSKLRVVGVQPDPAKARTWYARAAEQGSLEARQRLQQSALR